MPTVYFRMTNDDFMPCIHSWQYIFWSNAYVIPIPFYNGFYMSRISRIFLDVWWWINLFFGIPQDDSHAMLRTRWCLCGLRRDAVDPVRGRWSQPPKSPEMGGRNHRQVLGLWRCVSHSKNTLSSSSDPRPDPLFRQFLTYTTWKSLFLAYTLTFFLAFYLASILT